MSTRLAHKYKEILEDNWEFFLPPSSLERHYGISQGSVQSARVDEFVNIGGFPGLLVKWQIHLQKGQSQTVFTWFSSSTLSSLENSSKGLVRAFIWEDLHDLRLIFQETGFRGDQGRVAFVYGSSIAPGPITSAIRSNEEATNQHFVLSSSQTRIRVKAYSDPEKGLKEVKMASKLASANIYPTVRGSLDLISSDGRPFGSLALLCDELAAPQNIDFLTGKTYLKFLEGQISQDECLAILNGYLQQSFSAIRRLHTILNQRKIPPVEAKDSFRQTDEELRRRLEGDQFNFLRIDSNAREILSRKLIQLLHCNRASWIHGDVWWRQFIVDESNQIFILDIEDLRIGFLGEDFGSWINSIFQQAEYYAKDLELDSRAQVKNIAETLVSSLLEMLESHLQYKDITRVEINMGRVLRSIHELNYLVAHQPSETWLVQFIAEDCKHIMQSLTQDCTSSSSLITPQ